MLTGGGGCLPQCREGKLAVDSLFSVLVWANPRKACCCGSMGWSAAVLVFCAIGACDVGQRLRDAERPGLCGGSPQEPRVSSSCYAVGDATSEGFGFAVFCGLRPGVVAAFA